MVNHYIIGCGGVGSWLCPSLCLLVNPDTVTVIDGDKLEEKNLNRQFFSDDFIGENKATALAQLYECDSMPEWYNFGLMEHAATDWLFVCVDNNPARLAALEACDRFGCQAIFAANETTSAEAYLYLPGWKDSKKDPRVMYPELLTNGAGDPQAAAIGCTGKAQKENRQLVSANFLAAGLAQHLFVCWGLEYPKMKNQPQVYPHLPRKLVCNLSRIESVKVSEE